MNLSLDLYVRYGQPESIRAVQTVVDMVRGTPNVLWDIEVIDVLALPLLAEDERIVTTPTLVRKSPKPETLIIGERSALEYVRELGLL